MRKSRSLIGFIFLIIFIASLYTSRDTLGSVQDTALAARKNISEGPEVNLFTGQNTISWDARDPFRTRFELPVLYLRQERNDTAELERTLTLSLTGFKGGEEIAFEIMSQHIDISTGIQHTQARQVTLPDRECTPDDPCVLRWTIDPQTTPGDFYTLRVLDSMGRVLWQNPYGDRPDFVMLDRWDVGLDDYTVRIIYATLFPFARGQNDLDKRLAPGAVADFIEQQFVPIIIDTWETQFITWGLGNPIHPEWDADTIMDIIITDGPFALWDNIGTVSQFIGADNQPTKECRIWWSSSNNSFQAYRTLEDGVKAVYAHEFFHLVQRNVLLFTEHPDQRWMKVFIEAQGKFAPSVQYPEMELRRYGVQPHLSSEYLDSANRFLAQRLNTSYAVMEADPINKFDAALYWRFLYEQYGDMRFIETALVAMTSGYDDDIVSALEAVMNQTFAQTDSPFASFDDSLIAFARANYALRMHDGRCKEEDFTQCGGRYYDPSSMYVAPALEAELDYDGTRLSYEGAVPASFGMDFIEINLDGDEMRQSIQITLEGMREVSQFSVQVWPIAKAIPFDYVLTDNPVDMVRDEHGVYSYVMDNLDVVTGLKLALIITRLDTAESSDSSGLYTVIVDGLYTN